MNKEPRKVHPDTLLKSKESKIIYQVKEISKEKGIVLINPFDQKDQKTITGYELGESLETYKSIEILCKSKEGDYKRIVSKDQLDSLLKMVDLTTAVNFHLNCNYKGKVSNLSNDGIYGALNLSLDKKYGFTLNQKELKMVHDNVKQQKKQTTGVKIN